MGDGGSLLLGLLVARVTMAAVTSSYLGPSGVIVARPRDTPPLPSNRGPSQRRPNARLGAADRLRRDDRSSAGRRRLGAVSGCGWRRLGRRDDLAVREAGRWRRGAVGACLTSAAELHPRAGWTTP
jgi:hypothetical protein